jgi:hypothetical protein
MDNEKRLKEKYKCTASSNDGWCDGEKVGSRMRCPEHSLTRDRERVCRLGINKGFDDLLCDVL